MNKERLPSDLSPITVLFAVSEVDPIVKIGGLGDVAGSLPPAIQEYCRSNPDLRPVDIRVVMPYYAEIYGRIPSPKKIADLNIPTLDGLIQAELYESVVNNTPLYLISGPPIPASPGVYGKDAELDLEKFIFFSLACLQIPSALNWDLDILHLNDWHTAIAAYAINKFRKEHIELSSTCTILSLHNLPYMGSDARAILHRFFLTRSRNPSLPGWARSIPLPLGLASADRVVAVSPTYAKEIMTPEYGCGLDFYLQSRKKQVMGILNGLNIETWDPFTDKTLIQNFDSNHPENRIINKLALQKEFELPANPDVPLFILISRMDNQKGIDIAVKALRMIKNQPWQAILLGTGDPLLENACIDLQNEFPQRVRTAFTFDPNLSRRMYSGGDIILMPSRYEPCGLAQLIAMRYGCIPVARATGGLADTIIDPRVNSPGTGFLFNDALPTAMKSSLLRALKTFSLKTSWGSLQRNAMLQDYSWNTSAHQYYNLYHSMLKKLP